jgi:hypothetical protein
MTGLALEHTEEFDPPDTLLPGTVSLFTELDGDRTMVDRVAEFDDLDDGRERFEEARQQLADIKLGGPTSQSADGAFTTSLVLFGQGEDTAAEDVELARYAKPRDARVGHATLLRALMPFPPITEPPPAGRGCRCRAGRHGERA